jgi:hypothetical protein
MRRRRRIIRGEEGEGSQHKEEEQNRKKVGRADGKKGEGSGEDVQVRVVRRSRRVVRCFVLPKFDQSVDEGGRDGSTGSGAGGQVLTVGTACEIGKDGRVSNCVIRVERRWDKVEEKAIAEE